MFDLKEIEKNKFFKKRVLKNWEVLFLEWDLDTNIYVVFSWKLKVEKYFSEEKKESKLISFLDERNIFWEWTLNNNKPKEVSISAVKDSIVYYIENENFKNFLKEYLDLAIIFLKEIIDLSNKRLLETNFLLTSTYKISQMISQTDNFSNKNLFKIILEFQKILKAKYIIYLEINKVLDNYVNVLYDTREPNKMQNDFFQIKNEKINLENFKKFDLIENNQIIELKNGNKIVWFLIIWENEENVFSDSLKKSIESIWVLLWWFIRQKHYFQNEKNQEN